MVFPGFKFQKLSGGACPWTTPSFASITATVTFQPGSAPEKNSERVLRGDHRQATKKDGRHCIKYRGIMLFSVLGKMLHRERQEHTIFFYSCEN
jgi:hypothetical protein